MNQPQPPKDGMLPVGELNISYELQNILRPLTIRLYIPPATPLTLRNALQLEAAVEKDILALFTAATNANTLCYNCGMPLYKFEDRLQCFAKGCGVWQELPAAPTNEKLAGGGDDLRITDQELDSVVSDIAKFLDKGFPGNASNRLRQYANSLINTAKQTAVAEERVRLIGLLPKARVFGHLPKYRPEQIAANKAFNQAITEMRNVLEGK